MAVAVLPQLVSWAMFTGSNISIGEPKTNIKFINLTVISLHVRQKLREGIIKDDERQLVQQAMKKTINTYNLQQQIELEKILKREQLKDDTAKT